MRSLAQIFGRRAYGREISRSIGDADFFNRIGAKRTYRGGAGRVRMSSVNGQFRKERPLRLTAEGAALRAHKEDARR